VPAPDVDAAQLTFAVPFYRNAVFLRHTLDSIVAQTEPRWQALVIDDAGPEPEAAAVVASYADERIGYVRNNDNLGLGGNWNRGLDVATTDLVTILHADDELEPSYAEIVLAAHGRHPDAVAVHCRARIIGTGGNPVFSLPDVVKRWGRPYTGGRDLVSRGDAGLASLLRVNVIVCPTLCFRRGRLDGRRFDGRWGMVLDLDLVARLLLDGDTLVGVPDVAFRYRRHPESETSTMNASAVRFEEELALYDELASRTAARGWTRSARAARTKVMVRAHLLYRAATDVVAGRWSAARVKLGLLVGRDGSARVA
jgi:glycosyltransferase involved in cell wall biosynthesis